MSRGRQFGDLMGPWYAALGVAVISVPDLLAELQISGGYLKN